MANLETLKRRLGTDNAIEDALLTDLLNDAESYVIGYTGRERVPERLNGVVVELAAMGCNRLGMQGESAHSEGGVAVSAESLPEALRALLNRYRVARVV